MAGPTEKGPGPQRPGRPKMPFERIVSGALEIVDANGADALTFRSLAKHLDSSTATLYRHVASRAELLGHVVDHVIGEIEVSTEVPDDEDWSQACERFATGLFGALAGHPNAAPLLIEIVPTGPNAMVFRERCLSTLLAAGFTPDAAHALTATLGRFVIGFATQIREGTDRDDTDSRAGDRLRAADPDRYPATRATSSTGVMALADEFALGLGLLIQGMRGLEREHSRDGPSVK